MQSSIIFLHNTQKFCRKLSYTHRGSAPQGCVIEDVHQYANVHVVQHIGAYERLWGNKMEISGNHKRFSQALPDDRICQAASELDRTLLDGRSTTGFARTFSCNLLLRRSSVSKVLPRGTEVRKQMLRDTKISTIKEM